MSAHPGLGPDCPVVVKALIRGCWDLKELDLLGEEVRRKWKEVLEAMKVPHWGLHLYQGCDSSMDHCRMGWQDHH